MRVEFACVGVVVVAVLGLGFQRSATDEPEVLGDAAILEEFLSNPLGEGTNDIFALLADGEYEVTLTPELLGFVEGEEEVLLAAYAAGNMLSQAYTGVLRSDPYTGMVQMIRVYRHLKSVGDGSFREVSYMEDLLERHSEGRLILEIAQVLEGQSNERK